jgi:hypothetical protein
MERNNELKDMLFVGFTLWVILIAHYTYGPFNSGYYILFFMMAKELKQK